MNPLKTSTIALSLAARRRRAVFLIALSAPAVLAAMETLRVAAASTLGESADARTIERALRLDPDNPSLEHRLGLVLFYAPTHPDLASGLAHLRRATDLNPNEALYWSDLAAACEASHDLACADRSTERALALSPETPRVYWVAANYYLRTSRRDAALRLFRRLLALDPDYSSPTFEVCLRAFDGPSVLQETISGGSRSVRLELALVNFLGAHHQDGAAQAAWERVMAESRGEATRRFDYSDVAAYLDRLIQKGDAPEAESVWHDLETGGLLGALHPAASGEPALGTGVPRDLVFNGGFERAPLNSGFDWRYSPSGFLSLEFSAAVRHSGARALRLEFTADRNEAYEPVWQIVPVAPNQSYVLSAFARSDVITSDSGPRLRVQDALCPECLEVAGSGTDGTTPWHEVRVEFATGPRTRLVKVSVWRPRSRSFPPEIQGVFWLDDVSMRAAPSPAAPHRHPASGSMALLKTTP